MFYRILTADESVRGDEKIVGKDEATGLTLVSRNTLPEREDSLINKVIFASDGALYRYDTCGKPQLTGRRKNPSTPFSARNAAALPRSTVNARGGRGS